MDRVTAHTNGMVGQRRDARVVSSALFGNAAFAEVVTSADTILAAAGHSATVTTRQVAAATGAADSVVRPVMHRLAAAGLLVPLPKTGAANGPQLFVRAHPSSWQALISLVSDATGETTAVHGTSTRLPGEHVGTGQ